MAELALQNTFLIQESPALLIAYIPSMPRLDVRINTVTEAEWTELLHRYQDANFYQTWAFGAVSWGNDQLNHLILSQEGRTVGIAQLRIVRLPLLKTGVAYLRWGPCIRLMHETWSPELYSEMLKALVDEFVRRRGLLLRIIPNIFVEDPHSSEAIKVLHESGFILDTFSPSYRTIRVDLSPPPAQIRKNLDQKWRNQLNGAERNSLEVVEGTGDELYAKFLDLYYEMMDRKRFDTSVDPESFRKVQERLPPQSKMLISICSKDSKPLCALVGTAIGEAGIYLLGATSNEGMKSKGSYLLHWGMMNRLRDRGCLWYDLGGVNPVTNPGVYHFKKGMGGQECVQLGRFECRANKFSTWTVLSAERLKSSFARLKKRLQQGPPATPGASSPSPAMS